MARMEASERLKLARMIESRAVMQFHVDMMEIAGQSVSAEERAAIVSLDAVIAPLMAVFRQERPDIGPLSTGKVVTHEPEYNGGTRVVTPLTREESREYDMISYPLPQPVMVGCLTWRRHFHANGEPRAEAIPVYSPAARELDTNWV